MSFGMSHPHCALSHSIRTVTNTTTILYFRTIQQKMQESDGKQKVSFRKFGKWLGSRRDRAISALEVGCRHNTTFKVTPYGGTFLMNTYCSCMDGNHSFLQQVTGTSKNFQFPDVLIPKTSLPCGCNIARCNTFQHSKALIGGKEFNAGEKLIPGRRCGSVVTATLDGRSMYGLVKKFLRVICVCLSLHDLVVWTWFPRPTYPDRDPLTVRVDLTGVPDVNSIVNFDVVSLLDLEPSRILVELDRDGLGMYMMRMEGIDRV